jgi:hypothetical protein
VVEFAQDKQADNIKALACDGLQQKEKNTECDKYRREEANAQVY